MGLGGFGTHIIYQLACLGVKQIKAVDFDRVNISNLNRQLLFDEINVGSSKVDVAEKKLREINSQTEYDFINKKLESPDDIIEVIKDCDVAFLCADAPRGKIFKWANEACFLANIPMVFSLGFPSRFVRIGPIVVPKRTICFECSLPPIDFEYDDDFMEFINNKHKHGSIILHISIASGIMVLEFIKYITGFSQCKLYNSRIHFDVINYSCVVEGFKPRESCGFCRELK